MRDKWKIRLRLYSSLENRRMSRASLNEPSHSPSSVWQDQNEKFVARASHRKRGYHFDKWKLSKVTHTHLIQHYRKYLVRDIYDHIISSFTNARYLDITGSWSMFGYPILWDIAEKQKQISAHEIKAKNMGSYALGWFAFIHYQGSSEPHFKLSLVKLYLCCWLLPPPWSTLFQRSARGASGIPIFGTAWCTDVI